jgi:hypothetical protein
VTRGESKITWLKLKVKMICFNKKQENKGTHVVLLISLTLSPIHDFPHS